jgi:hypothetical protein
LSVETEAIGAVDEVTADALDRDDDERMVEVVGEGIIDEVGLVESDVVVEVAPVPQKNQQDMVVGFVMNV